MYLNSLLWILPSLAMNRPWKNFGAGVVREVATNLVRMVIFILGAGNMVYMLALQAY